MSLPSRNTRRLLAQGAHEVGRGHYPLIVARPRRLARHACGGWRRAARSTCFWLALFVLLEVARIWVLATLGPRWTTRIIVLPGEPLVAPAPIASSIIPIIWSSIGEIAVLPLVFGLWQVALIFSLSTPPF